MVKVTFIRIADLGLSTVRGIGSNRQREFTVGTACEANWGGGVIERMELVAPDMVQIWKSTPFVGPANAATGKRETFDFVTVRVNQYAGTEVKDEEAPAKPVQNQNQGQQQRR